MRHLLSLSIVAATAMMPACSAGDSRAVADTTPRRLANAVQQPAIPHDTQTVIGAGVPSDVDDTGSTHYGKHQTPRRLSSPRCRPEGIAFCLRDTATRVLSVDCCMADERQTDWLVFAAARDSLQLFMEPSLNAYLTVSPPNAAGAGAETSLGVDASWLRSRFAVAGTYVYTASVESNSAAPYELRVASVIATGASQPIGAAARLTIRGAKKASIAVAPRSMMPQNDSTALHRFAVKAGVYHVLLVRDSVYTACALPCANPITFLLGPGQDVAIAP